MEQKNDTSNWCWNFNFFDLFVVGSESSNVGSGHGWRILWNIFLRCLGDQFASNNDVRHGKICFDCFTAVRLGWRAYECGRHFWQII